MGILDRWSIWRWTSPDDPSSPAVKNAFLSKLIGDNMKNQRLLIDN
jgi:hypothetical protein